MGDIDLGKITHEEAQRIFNELKAENQALRNFLDMQKDQAEFLTIITENMLDMVVLSDLEGNITVAGKAHEKLGYEDGFLIGKNVLDFVHPEHLPNVLEEYNKLLVAGGPRTVEYRFRCKDGSYMWLETVGKLINDESNNPRKIVFSARDITERKQAEETFQEKERHYRLLFEQSPLGVFHIDKKGVIVSCNDNFVKIIGSPQKALVGLDINTLPDQKIVMELRKALAGSHGYYEDVYHSVTANKSTPVRVYFSPLRTEDGIVIGCTGIVEDITEQTQSEQALRRSENYYRAIFETSGTAMFIIEEDTTISHVNSNFEELSGYSSQEVEGEKTWTEFIHPDDVGWMKEYHYLRRKNPDATPRQYEFRFINRHCEDRNILLTVDMIPGTNQTVASCIDITKRKQAEQKLRESEEKYRRIAENITDVLWTADPNLNLTYVSSSVRKLLGESPEQHMRRTMAEKHPPVYLDKIYQALAEELEKENDPASDKDRSRLIEVEHYKADGSTIWVSMNISAIRDEYGNLVGLQGVTRDITEQKKLQDQLHQAQKMESVGRLAGGVAHDFNNMLTIINGYAEMMADVLPSSDPMYESVQEIQDAGKRSAVIVRKLLAFARKQTIAPVPMNLNDSVSGMLKMLHQLIGENIDLLWNPGNNTWPVKMDHSQIDQILANLVVNARDAISDTGKITIESQNIEFDEQYCADHTGFVPGEFVMLVVSDNGCGMDKHVLDNVFEPFFTTKEIGQGTGLGLPTVYGIVKQNNGFINVYSEPGQGTTVKIYFPRLLEDADVSDKKQNEEALPKGCGETILVLEDEAVVLDLTRIMLERMGYNVITASRPGEAMEVAKAHSGKIDLLLSDIIMPEMNGREFAEQLNDLYPDIKTLFMSGYTENVIAHHTILDNGLHFIEKPFSMYKLAAKVRELLSKT